MTATGTEHITAGPGMATSLEITSGVIASVVGTIRGQFGDNPSPYISIQTELMQPYPVVQRAFTGNVYTAGLNGDFDGSIRRGVGFAACFDMLVRSADGMMLPFVDDPHKRAGRYIVSVTRDPALLRGDVAQMYGDQPQVLALFEEGGENAFSNNKSMWGGMLALAFWGHHARGTSHEGILARDPRSATIAGTGIPAGGNRVRGKRRGPARY